MITKEPLGLIHPAYNHACCSGFTQVLIRQDGVPLLQLYGPMAKLEAAKLMSWAADIRQALIEEGVPEEHAEKAIGVVLSQKLVGDREGYNRAKAEAACCRGLSNEELAS